MGPEDNRGGGGGARGATANEDDEFDDGFVFAGDDASAGDWDGAFDDTNALTPGGASGAGAVSWLIDAVPRLLAAATSRCVAAFACTGSGVHREDTAGDVLHQTAATLAQLRQELQVLLRDEFEVLLIIFSSASLLDVPIFH